MRLFVPAGLDGHRLRRAGMVLFSAPSLLPEGVREPCSTGLGRKGGRELATQGSPWHSLEVAKFVASVLTPIAIAGLGILVNRNAKRAEKSAAENAKRAEELAADRARHFEEAQWANR